MKLWKKAAAAVLAAVMSLTLLTGCSGGGGGGGDGSLSDSVRDEKQEKQVTEWIQEYAKDAAGVTLVKDEDAVKASDEALSDAIRYVNLTMTSPDSEATKRAQVKMSTDVYKVLNPKGKAGMPLAAAFVAEVTPKGIKQVFDTYGNQVWQAFKDAGIKPSMIGVVVTTVNDDGLVYVVVTIAGTAPAKN